MGLGIDHGTVFVLLQVLAPVHTAISSNLGDRTAAWLYDRLTEALRQRSIVLATTYFHNRLS